MQFRAASQEIDKVEKFWFVALYFSAIHFEFSFLRTREFVLNVECMDYQLHKRAQTNQYTWSNIEIKGACEQN